MVAKANLANISTYLADLVDSVALTDNLTDSSGPGCRAGLDYLVRPGCLVGGWQASLGAVARRGLVFADGPLSRLRFFDN